MSKATDVIAIIEVVTKDGYNLDKDVCDRCGITQKEAEKHPVATGINHPQYKYSTSFYLGTDGSVLCARCHKEKELEDLFKTMNARDAARKKKS